MSTIEKYTIKDSGYHPFLIRDGWQVAQLNYDEKRKIENNTRPDIHNHTDEVLILLKGQAVLITAKLEQRQPQFELMKPETTYNIPQRTWHNIAMNEGREVIIVEKSDTHISDFEFYDLFVEIQYELRDRIRELM